MLQLEEKMKDNKDRLKIVKPLVILFVWAFPFAIGAIPFMIFFNPDRTQWLKDNGYDGLDFNEEAHSILRAILIIVFIIEIVGSVAYYIYFNRKNSEE